MRNKARFERLRSLSPLEAAAAWLDGDFGVGDEAALIEALRKDEKITCTDDEIVRFFTKALGGEKRDAQQCLHELAVMDCS